MDKSHLIETAKKLPEFSSSVAQEYENKIDTLVNSMNQTMLSRPDINDLVGEKNIEMMKDNHANHAHFIASILNNFNAEILVDTILWVFRAYRSRGFHTNYWAAQLNAWKKAINQDLPENSSTIILELYNWMQINIPTFTIISDNKLEEMSSKKINH